MNAASGRLTTKEQIDEALRAEEGVLRGHLLVELNLRAYEHVRSYIVNEKYRGASVAVIPEQLEEWVIRQVNA